MNPSSERVALQLAIGLACAVPITAGISGIVGAFDGPATSAETSSHVRYLSGLLLAIGLAFLWCTPRVESRSASMRLLAFLVVVGGTARALSTPVTGVGPVTAFALLMELGVVPLLCLWQARVSRLMR